MTARKAGRFSRDQRGNRNARTIHAHLRTVTIVDIRRAPAENDGRQRMGLRFHLQAECADWNRDRERRPQERREITDENLDSGDRCSESELRRLLGGVPSLHVQEAPAEPTSSTAEGAYYADFNRDGKLDVVAGPFWYEGPDFQKRHEIRPPKAFDPKDYSDNFLTFTGDFNGDGWPDVLYVAFPGGEAYWYENPAGKDRPVEASTWRLKDVGNESPMWVDINGDGRPELIYNTTATWATPPTIRPSPTSRGSSTHHAQGQLPAVHPRHRLRRHQRRRPHRHWSKPTAGGSSRPTPKPGKPWIRHPFHFADAGAQMFVYDVDGDGLNDVITAWHCHQYGLVWYKQIRNAKGEITWQQHVILPPKPDLKSHALRISQMHAMDLVDINGDGLKDIVTGKRFWAHGPHGDAEPNAPAVLYWFELRRDKEQGRAVHSAP